MRRNIFFASIALAALSASAQSRSNFAGPDQFICGTSAFMQANPLGAGETGFWSVVQGTAEFIAPGSPTSPVIGLSFGENVLRWTIYATGGPVSDQVAVWCYNSAMPLADAGQDQTVGHWPGTTTLNATPPIAPGTCFWEVISGSAVIAEPNNPQSAVSGLGAGINMLQWNCDNGPCGSSSDLMAIDAVVGVQEWMHANGAIRYDVEQHALRLPNGCQPSQVLIMDGQGRLAQALRPSAATELLWLSEMPQGPYAAVAICADGARAIRFVMCR